MAEFEVRIDPRALDSQVGAVGRSRMVSLQRRVANQARQDVPVRTGNLGRSIGEGVVRMVAPRVVSGSVHAAARYAAAVHDGRGARTIVPVRAAALRFTVGGRVVFARVVHQGPVKGRPFLLNAARRIAAQET